MWRSFFLQSALVVMHEAIRLFLCIVILFASVLSWFCSILRKLEFDGSILSATLQTGYFVLINLFAST